MKKLVVALSIFTLTLSLSSCDLLNSLKKHKSTEAQTQKPLEIRIYSNAYDGYVNVRTRPNAKSAILGRLKNGQDYLVQLGVEGKWTKV